MKRDEERHSPEPQELGIASVETKGLGWQAPEVGGYVSDSNSLLLDIAMQTGAPPLASAINCHSGPWNVPLVHCCSYLTLEAGIPPSPTVEALIGFFSRRRAPGHRSLHPL